MTQEQIKIASEWESKFNKFVSENYPAFKGEFEGKVALSPSVADPLILQAGFKEDLIINPVIRKQMVQVFEEFVKQARV